MIPISDDNPTLHTPYMTYVLIGLTLGAWFFLQGLGTEPALVASVCNLGLVPGEITGLARVGDAVPIAEGILCVVDDQPINVLTPLLSMFLHGGWGHLLGNLLFFWVFGNNVEDSMGHWRFAVFYVLCGLVAAGAQVITAPASPVPMVGASGAIAGVMGAYLVLYPRVRVTMFFPPFFFIPVVAWVVLIWWFVVQVFSGLPMLNAGVGEGVAFWAHVGGFVAGAVLIKLFENRAWVRERAYGRHRLHPERY